MNSSIKSGLSFGLTSAIITTLGLMVGLNSATNSIMVVIGGIITIAFADGLSDALGMHISAEANIKHHKQNLFEVSISTFIAKLVVALSFIIPIIFFDLKTAIIINIIYGLVLLSFLSFQIAKSNQENALSTIIEHTLVAIVVIVISSIIGSWVAITFA